jgi:hypothetical protein
MRKPRIYLITWIDSVSNTGWKHSFELETGNATMQTIGFYVMENKDYITLALSRDTTGNNSPFGDLISIPKVAIKKKKIFYGEDN